MTVRCSGRETSVPVSRQHSGISAPGIARHVFCRRRRRVGMAWQNGKTQLGCKCFMLRTGRLARLVLRACGTYIQAGTSIGHGRRNPLTGLPGPLSGAAAVRRTRCLHNGFSLGIGADRSTLAQLDGRESTASHSPRGAVHGRDVNVLDIAVHTSFAGTIACLAVAPKYVDYLLAAALAIACCGLLCAVTSLCRCSWSDTKFKFFSRSRSELLSWRTFWA